MSAGQAVRAGAAEARALADRDEKQAALTQVERGQAETAAALAEARAQLATRQAVKGFYSTRILQAGRPKGAENGLGKDVTLRQAVAAAAGALDTAFPGRPAVEAAIRHKLAETYNFLDDKPAALRHYQRTLGLWAAAGRSPDDPDPLQTVNDIAVGYSNCGRRPEAVPLLEHVLAVRRAALGAADPLTLHSLNNLAAAYYYVGRTAEWVALQEEAYRLRRARLGERHTDTLRSVNNLAGAYTGVGRLADAVRLFEDLLAVRRELDRDPATASPLNTHIVMSNLGQMYLDARRDGDATRVLEEAAPLRRANLPTTPAPWRP